MLFFASREAFHWLILLLHPAGLLALLEQAREDLEQGLPFSDYPICVPLPVIVALCSFMCLQIGIVSHGIKIAKGKDIDY